MVIVAFVPLSVSIVRVRISIDIKASSRNILDSLSVSVVPSHFLEHMSSVSVYNSSIVVVFPVSSSLLDGNNEVSVGTSSDSLGSVVEDPPLFDIVWVVVSDSKSVLVRSNVFSVEKSSSVSHCRLDLELDSILQWVSWEVNSSSVKGPTLVGSIVAVLEDDNSIFSITILNIQTFGRWVSEVSS